MVKGPVSEAEPILIGKAADGDYRAFESLVGLYEKRMYGVAMRILRHKEDAEDATQKTFLSLIENLKDFRGDAPLGVWLTKVVANHALQTLRKRRGLDVMSSHLDDADEDYAHLPAPVFIAPWQKSPEDLAALGEVRAITERALEELPESLRLVFLLRDVEGFSTEDTAETLGIKQGTVKVRLLRARLKLREFLTRAFGSERWLGAHLHVSASKTR